MALQEDSAQNSLLAEELEQVESRLKVLDQEQQRLLSWVVKDFPEQMIDTENKRINRSRAELEKRKAELESRVETALRIEVDIEEIKEACKLVGNNLTELSFSKKTSIRSS